MPRILLLLPIFLLLILPLENIYCFNKGSGKITILHTNDIHGNFLPIIIKLNGKNPRERKLGGMLALDSFISGIRQETPHVLLFDAGDFMTGNPICDIEYQGALGGAMIKFFNLLKYDGLTLGNHEFDISIDNVRNLMAIAELPIFSANLYSTDNHLFTTEAYHIYQQNDVAVGVIGVIVDDLPTYLNSPQRDRLIVKPASSAIDSVAKLIDAETDLIVVLSHSGIEKDKELAQSLGEEIDVIIGGHNHTRIKQAIQLNNKLIVQAGDKCANLGRLDLLVEDDKVKDFQYELIPLWNENIKPRPELIDMVDHYQTEIDREYGRIIGELVVPWRRSSAQESNIGNFIADCIGEFSQADFALINSGGIRSDLEAGPLKKLDIKNILPFANSITKFSASGSEILQIIQLNAEAAAFGKSGILQLSKLNYEWEKITEDKIKIVSAKIGAFKIVPDKIYAGATVDFVIANAGKYFGFAPSHVQDLMMPLTEVVIKKIEQQKKIISKIEGRIIQK